MVPHLLFPETPHAVLVPCDTPPDPSTTNPSETKPDGATTLHIIIGVVVFGIVASILVCAKHKFGNSAMRRKTKEGAKQTGRCLELGSLPIANLPPVPPAHGTPGNAIPTQDKQVGYCGEPPFPHPRRGIKEASPPRQTHQPVVVTNEEYFFGASPRRGPADRRHDGADPSRQGSPDKRTGRGRAGRFCSLCPSSPRQSRTANTHLHQAPVHPQNHEAPAPTQQSASSPKPSAPNAASRSPGASTSGDRSPNSPSTARRALQLVKKNRHAMHRSRSSCPPRALPSPLVQRVPRDGCCQRVRL